MLKRQYKYTLLWGSEQLERKFGEKHPGLSLPGNFNLSQWNKVLLHCLIYFLDSRAWPQTDITLENNNTRYCGFWSNRTLPYFPLSSSVRPPFVRHRRDILTFLDILTVYTMKTIYFLNAYHPGW